MDRDGLIDRYLAAPPRSRSEVFTRPSPIPAAPGVYGWWFRFFTGSGQHCGMPAKR